MFLPLGIVTGIYPFASERHCYILLPLGRFYWD